MKTVMVLMLVAVLGALASAGVFMLRKDHDTAGGAGGAVGGAVPVHPAELVDGLGAAGRPAGGALNASPQATTPREAASTGRGRRGHAPVGQSQ
jgi:hypothetical protein